MNQENDKNTIEEARKLLDVMIYELDEFEIESLLRKKGVYTPARNILSNLISICEK